MRDLFLSFRSFFKRVADFVRYRNATRDMNARYPDATPDEVGREDVCIICREEMRPAPPTTDANGPPQRMNPVAERMRPKKLPCGHILHFSCLRSWLERQQNCPTCRRPVNVIQRTQGQTGNRLALAGDGPGQHGDAPELAGRDRARVINFGPFRIGFGAGGGNLVGDLAQRIHNGEQGPPPEQPANGGNQQHFGFGFGFGRRPNLANQTQAASTTASIQTQLDIVERSLQQQINNLRLASNELHLVRMLNTELLRLRDLQANNASHEAAIPPPLHAAPAPSLPPGQGQPPPIQYQPPTTMLSGHSQQLLTSDSSALPEGVALPPGWTLMPLQRYDGPHRTVVNHDGNTPIQPAPGSVPPAVNVTHIASQSHPSADLPEHLMPRSSLATPSNGTHLESPAVSPTRTPQTGPSLPSWGSAPVQSSGRNPVEQTRDISPVTNGQAHSGAAANAAETREEGVSKGKNKAATVEDLADDVD